MARILITGASGFIGRALAGAFRERGAEVVGVDRVADPNAGVVAGEISRPGSWQNAAEAADIVVHTAALVGMPSDVSSFWDVNVRGTRLALEAAHEAGAKRFVHLSSVVTFGLDFPDGVDESWPVRTTGVAYMDTKVAAEQVVLQAHAAGEIEVTVIRPATSTDRARGRGRSCRSSCCAGGGSPSPPAVAGSTAPSTSTTWSRGSCARPRKSELRDA